MQWFCNLGIKKQPTSREKEIHITGGIYNRSL